MLGVSADRERLGIEHARDSLSAASDLDGTPVGPGRWAGSKEDMYNRLGQAARLCLVAIHHDCKIRATDQRALRPAVLRGLVFTASRL